MPTKTRWVIAPPMKTLVIGVFVDTGVPRLFRAVAGMGGEPGRFVVKVAGGARMMDTQDIFSIGQRNAEKLKEVLNRAGYAIAEKEFWRQSLATAATTEVVAASGLVHGDWESMAFTAGLLQDMGELVIGCNLAPNVVSRMRERVDSGALSRIEAEREELGTDHAEVGACLLESWHLPGDMVEAVANHHQPVLDPEPRLSVVTHLGDGLAHLAGGAPGWGAYAVRVSGDVVRRLGIDEPRLEGLVIAARSAIERMEKFMSGI